MTEATRVQIIESLRESRGREAVHIAAQNTVVGARAGNIYFLPGRPSRDDMAAITRSTVPHNLEVALLRVNGHYFVTVGPVDDAIVNLPNFQRNEAVNRYDWIYLTHPREHPIFRRRRDNSQPLFHAGPTDNDLDAFAEFEDAWGRQYTEVLVCNGGNVEENGVIPFRGSEEDFQVEPLPDEQRERVRELMRRAREQREQEKSNLRRKTRALIERNKSRL